MGSIQGLHFSFKLTFSCENQLTRAKCHTSALPMRKSLRITSPPLESLHYECMTESCEFLALITIVQSFFERFALKMYQIMGSLVPDIFLNSHAQNISNFNSREKSYAEKMAEDGLNAPTFGLYNVHSKSCRGRMLEMIAV